MWYISLDYSFFLPKLNLLRKKIRMFEDIQIKVSHPLVSDEHNEKNMKVSL